MSLSSSLGLRKGPIRNEGGSFPRIVLFFLYKNGRMQSLEENLMSNVRS